MDNKFIKLNNGKDYLSIGNVIYYIKKYALNPLTANQTYIFGIMFDDENILDTTVNNYCTGIRNINVKYRSKYFSLLNKYREHKEVMLPIICSITNIIDDKEVLTIEDINKSKMKKICLDLYNVSKNDKDLEIGFEHVLSNYITNNEYYYFICEVLFFTILERNQPIYNDDIDKVLINTNIPSNDYMAYLDLKLNGGCFSFNALKELALKNNACAAYELAGLEYKGYIMGYPRYAEAYKYYKIAQNKKHPAATWMLGVMHLKHIFNLDNDKDLELAWYYFNEAYKYGSIAAINSIGSMYLDGLVPPKYEINEDEAVKYFIMASKKEYVYAYNNLGKYYEDKGNKKDSFKYYLKSALKSESWACNKVGEIYRIDRMDDSKALEFYLKGILSSVNEVCYYNYYNLAKYYYLNGNYKAGIEKDIGLAKKYFVLAFNNGVKEASIELDKLKETID